MPQGQLMLFQGIWWCIYRGPQPPGFFGGILYFQPNQVPLKLLVTGFKRFLNEPTFLSTYEQKIK